jgi:hypothetical protein
MHSHTAVSLRVLQVLQSSVNNQPFVSAHTTARYAESVGMSHAWCQWPLCIQPARAQGCGGRRPVTHNLPHLLEVSSTGALRWVQAAPETTHGVRPNAEHRALGLVGNDEVCATGCAVASAVGPQEVAAEEPGDILRLPAGRGLGWGGTSRRVKPTTQAICRLR